jgi:hypothetical protein
VAFSADSRTVITASEVLPLGKARGEVRMWDAATGKPRGAPLRVDHSAREVAIGARGKTKVLVSAGVYHLLREMWSPEQKEMMKLPSLRDHKYISTGKITLWELVSPGSATP